jgi:hypothetical protein
VEALLDMDVTHVLGIPDNGTAPLFDRLTPGGGSPPYLLTTTREGEAFATAAGLWVGGARPFVSVQGTGLLESGDAIRGTVVRMGVPVLCMIGYRGWAKMRRAGLEPDGGPWSPPTLRRPDVDSAALYLEPTLRAWGLPYEVLEGPDPREQFRTAWRRAVEDEHPRMLLLTQGLTP